MGFQAPSPASRVSAETPSTIADQQLQGGNSTSELVVSTAEPAAPHFTTLGDEIPPGYATAERLMPQMAALGDEALSGLFCVALERRPWLKEKVFGAVAQSTTEVSRAPHQPSPTDVPRPAAAAPGA